MRANLRIRRFNPEQDTVPWWGEYTVENVKSSDSVLDVLHRVKWEHDGTLTLRRSCGHGVCGSDAMRINGRNRLACATVILHITNKGSSEIDLQIEPIAGLPVIKDLVVDMTTFYAHNRQVMPHFINNSPPPENGRERLQSPEQRARFDDTTKCILCAACTTSCPIFWGNGRYVGPAAIVQAHRFIFDSRDEAGARRLNVLNDGYGAWRCRTNYNCTNACPRDIKVTQAIAEVKMALVNEKI
ncbi:MAG: succinate dehydrogenase iron-sulfur subunit [Anaerolineaceae bacterium]|nr:succinate dehydrogenase iron-sulfur subunit [Anaerolineaceae bacterium]